MALSLIYVTFPSEDAARELVRGALDKRLAACATYWNVGSTYWWHGAIEVGSEAVALFKTAPSRVRALRAWLTEHHPYELPCIIELRSGAVHPQYEAWAKAEVGARTTTAKRKAKRRGPK